MPIPTGSAFDGTNNKNSNNKNGDASKPMKRTSNTDEDAVSQRAMLILQMATSVETSNTRRRRKLDQIESGSTVQVQREIEDIMDEQPLDMMTLLKEVDPVALPSARQLREQYDQESDDEDHNEEEEEDSGEDSGEDSNGEMEVTSKKSIENTSVDSGKDRKEDFEETQDLIVETPKQAPLLLPKSHTIIPSEPLMAHNEPLQDQLKRSYAAIVKLRENSDLRYQALEKKYLELKHSSPTTPGVQGAIVVKGGGTTNDGGGAVIVEQDGPAAAASSEQQHQQLNHAFEAIVRLRENSDLRYGVLESKYLDLKRSHAETDSRNERLETDLETMRQQLAQQHQQQQQGGSNNTNGNCSNCGISNDGGKSNKKNKSFPSLLEQLPHSSSAHARKRHKKGGDKNSNDGGGIKLQQLMVDYQTLCEKVKDCDTCIDHVPSGYHLRVKQQLARLERGETMMDTSNASHHSSRSRCSHHNRSFRRDDDESDDSMADTEHESDDDSSWGDANDESDENTFVHSMASSSRHEGAMSLLGTNWHKLEQINERAPPQSGTFANLSESKAEQKLRGKRSQFVAAQSGVYCRIDHDMKDQYGDLDKFRTPQRPAPPTPPPASAATARRQPPKPKSVPPVQAAPQASPAPIASQPAPVTPLRNPSGVKLAPKEIKEFVETVEETTPTHAFGGKRSPVKSPTSVVETAPEIPAGQEMPKPPSQRIPVSARRKISPPHEGSVPLNSQVSLVPHTNGESLQAKDENQHEDHQPSQPNTSRRSLQSLREKKPAAPVPTSAQIDTDQGWPGEALESEMDASRSSVTSKPKRTPPAKLDAKEREAKKKQALKDAKAAAKNGRSSFIKNPFKKKSASVETAEMPPARSKTSSKLSPSPIATKPIPGQSVRRSSSKRASKGKPMVEC